MRQLVDYNHCRLVGLILNLRQGTFQQDDAQIGVDRSGPHHNGMWERIGRG
jgi:hypothetical protein